jgi:hypothetical protein
LVFCWHCSYFTRGKINRGKPINSRDTQHEAQPIEHANERSVRPYIDASERHNHPHWRRWLDRLLVVLWLPLSLTLVAALAWNMIYYVDFPQFNTMWESAPLQVAWNIARGESAYGNWQSGPVHLAIYGPLYYYLVGFLGWLGGATPLDMVAAGRWLSVTTFIAGLLGVGVYVRRNGGPLWACAISLACVAFITPTGVRFISSSRPDALSVAFSIWAVICIIDTQRRGMVLSALLLVAAVQTRPNALAAAIAVFLFLVITRQWRRLSLLSILFVGLNAVILAGLWWASDGWIWRHLTFSGDAPMSWRYTWHMLTRNGWPLEFTLLLALPLSALLTLQLGNLRFPPGSRIRSFMTLATVYYFCALILALMWSMRQGGDRNYMIEPALAAGMLLGVWSGMLIRQRAGLGWLLGRSIAGLALLAVAVHVLPEAFSKGDAARRLVRIRTPYQQQYYEEIRQLSGPVLSLDSWLAFRAGVQNDLNDPIAYYSYALTTTEDPVTRRVRRGCYDHVVTRFPIEDVPPRVYGDIKAAWPGVMDALRSNYQRCGHWGIWYVYQPRRIPCSTGTTTVHK